MKPDPYATTKAFAHPHVVRALKEKKTHRLAPVFVHLMPQNACNHDCWFCSYRLENWKNSEIFDKTTHIPEAKLIEIIGDLEEMGTKAVELTGGGEPMMYPHRVPMLKRLAAGPLEVGLVTNGTLVNDKIANLLYEAGLVWARVSIDAGSPASYATIRRIGEEQWDKAWRGLDRLVARREDQVIGVGFVVTDQNWDEVYEGCRLSKEHGADNVRVSFAFTPKGTSLLTADQQSHASSEVMAAVSGLNDDAFTVVDLFHERLDNTIKGEQDYDYCPSKDLLCVIEGSCDVFTCCTLAGDPRGLMGSVKDQRFSELWWKQAEWRGCYDVRTNCKVACLYEKRNLSMNAVSDGTNPSPQPYVGPHKNFI